MKTKNIDCEIQKEVEDIGYEIQKQIGKKYKSLTEYCEREGVGYKKFAYKLSRIKGGGDFRFSPIQKTLKSLGYKFIIVEDK